MSNILYLKIQSDLNNCKTSDEVQDIKKKYSKAFNNAVDAQEFSRMTEQKITSLGLFNS